MKENLSSLPTEGNYVTYNQYVHTTRTFQTNLCLDLW
jgi:hypothetical protein